jgi:hypothetical protein
MYPPAVLAPTELLLRCACGNVRARAIESTPTTTNRVVCYCRDCRAFARWLGRPGILDAAGGTDVVQVARSRVVFDAGVEHLACVRLSAKGLYRWYASCCRSPVGNTAPALPFLGVVGAFFDPADASHRETATPPLVRIQTRRAVGAVPPGSAPALPMFLRVARLLTSWTLHGLGGETLFDPRTRQPRVTPRVLTAEERAALEDA